MSLKTKKAFDYDFELVSTHFSDIQAPIVQNSGSCTVQI